MQKKENRDWRRLILVVEVVLLGLIMFLFSMCVENLCHIVIKITSTGEVSSCALNPFGGGGGSSKNSNLSAIERVMRRKDKLIFENKIQGIHISRGSRTSVLRQL